MIGKVPKDLKGTDHPFRDSKWVDYLPAALRRVALDLTYDEAHAMELGTIGIPLTLLYLSGYVSQLIAGTAGLILLSVAMFKLPRESGVFAEMLSTETWYFLLVFVATSVLTAIGHGLIA